MNSNRGGVREGAGRKPSNKQTVVVRVPVELLPMIEDAKLGKEPRPVPELELSRTGAIKPKKGKAKDPVVPHSTAIQFSTIAISQLSRISDDDPKGREALAEVMDYIKKRIANID